MHPRVFYFFIDLLNILTGLIFVASLLLVVTGGGTKTLSIAAPPPPPTMRAHAHGCACVRAGTHARTQVGTHAGGHARGWVCTRAGARPCMHTHGRAWACAGAHACTHVRGRSRPRPPPRPSFQRGDARRPWDISTISVLDKSECSYGKRPRAHPYLRHVKTHPLGRSPTRNHANPSILVARGRVKEGFD